jgi:glyoxylase-like metal-dependent hydrolase (beta-lactamase superfamily II)
MSLLIKNVVADLYGTNCWIIAPAIGSEALIVDPGIAQPSLWPRINQALEENHLKVAAVFLTHGHIDHTFSAIIGSAEFLNFTTYIGRADAPLLSNPGRGMSAQSQELLREWEKQGVNWSEPTALNLLDDETVIEIAGLSLRVIPAPGHTKGSIIARVNDELLISGDVLFKEGIGRTDLPGGSMVEMRKTLGEVIAKIDESLIVLPGHGERTTMKSELEKNPYLRAAIAGEL